MTIWVAQIDDELIKIYNLISQLISGNKKLILCVEQCISLYLRDEISNRIAKKHGIKNLVGAWLGDDLEKNEQDTSSYELALWRKLMQPVSIAVMLLVALSFIFGPLRSVSMGARIVMGVITGIVFHLSDKIFGPIVLVYELPPAVGAVFPSILFMAISIYLIKKRS